jgi:hypothetical protein
VQNRLVPTHDDLASDSATSHRKSLGDHSLLTIAYGSRGRDRMRGLAVVRALGATILPVPDSVPANRLPGQQELRQTQ